jgi:type VI secretion system protein ImpA
MPLSEELLRPIPGDNPSGENLRYAPVYDKIKDARRQDDDAPQGEWRRERKLSDWPLTIKLITEALTNKSKDLQLAAWLTEALLRRDGIPGLKDGLELLRGLVENFWDTVYPELEDGDAEFRASPLQWVGEKLDRQVKEAPLTRSKLNFYQFKESRAIGYEADAVDNESKTAARQEAIAEGKITGEDFDAAFDATPKSFYAQLLDTCEAVRETIEGLTELCDAKFGDVAPSFGRLRDSIEEVRQTVHILLQKKRVTEPDAAAAPVEDEAPAEVEAEPEVATASTSAAAAPARAPVRKAPAGEPATRDDAVEQVIAAARFIRREEPYSPVPYLMLRGLRWGELRANGDSIDASLLEPPPGEIRQHLKRLSLDGNWTEVLDAAESAMALPCGRGWLDIQRYVGRACYELGSWYDPVALAVKSAVSALLRDFPALPEMTLMDDTPAANAETVAWLKEIAPPVGSAAPAISMAVVVDDSGERAVDGPPDSGELAMQAAAAGRPQEGIEILSREISRERSGRARFHRKVQLAQLCLSIGREAIALPILNDLAQEIEQRKLDEWEAPDAVAHPLSLLFHCLAKLDGDNDEKRRLYNRICRLDPVQALSCPM